uniref:Uncharacterized protein n=1 Tax=Anguilla anguilla TaxID=7936 RepID=A0A0E9TSP5_ANGAN
MFKVVVRRQHSGFLTVRLSRLHSRLGSL